MVLNTKHFEILKELKKEDDLRRIANVFNQTERNIRYKISELNDSLGQEKIFIKKRKIFCMLDEKDIASLIKGINDHNYVYEQKERIDLLIVETILQRDEFQLEEISELLQMSKSTLRADVKILNTKLSKMGIHLKQYNNKGWNLVYKNSDLVYYLAIFLYQYVLFDEGGERVRFKKTNYFEKLISEKLSALYLKNLEESYQKIRKIDLSYTDETLNLLLLLIAVLKERTLDTQELDVLNKKVLKETKEFKVLQKTFSELSEMSLYFLTDYLLRISCDEKEIFLRHRNWLEIELGVYRLIKEFESLKNVQLVKNKKFLDDVLFYIKPLIYRSAKGIELKNTVLNEVKSIYGDTFYYLKKAFCGFSKLLQLEISDNEIGFLVPIFEVALRNRVREERKVILISSYKRNLINFLRSCLEEEFLIEVLKVISMKQLDNIEQEVADLIITTSDLSLQTSIPICRVSPILTDIDRVHLEEAGLAHQDQKIPLEKLITLIERNVDISSWNKNKLEEELVKAFPNNILDQRIQESKEEFMIPKELYLEADLFDWKEAIRLAAEILWKEKYIKKSYIEEIIKKSEKESLILFLNEKTAMFYTEPKGNVMKTGFSLIKVKQALEVRDKKIENFICFAPKGDAEDQKLLYQLNDYFEEMK